METQAGKTFPCPKCSTKVLKTTGYCMKCKKKVKEASYALDRFIEAKKTPCVKCEAPLPADAKFCAECGKKVKQPKVEATFIETLISLASQLDEQGLEKQADLLDNITQSLIKSANTDCYLCGKKLEDGNTTGACNPGCM